VLCGHDLLSHPLFDDVTESKRGSYAKLKVDASLGDASGGMLKLNFKKKLRLLAGALPLALHSAQRSRASQAPTIVIDPDTDDGGSDSSVYALRGKAAVVSYSYAHSVLGHPHAGAMDKMKLRGLIRHLDWSGDGFKADSPCIPCAEGKSRKPDRPKYADRPARGCGDKVYCDIQTITAPSVDDIKYVILFIDSYSRFACVYGLHRKSDSAKALLLYLSFCKRSGYQVRAIQTDMEAVFVGTGSRFRDACTRRGVDLSYSVPYMHHQNGIVERLISTLLRRALVSIAQAGISNAYWFYAIKHACHLYCMTASEGLKWDHPFSRWYSGQTPTGQYLHVFGCQAVANTPPEQRQNFVKPPSRRGIYLGFAGWESLSTYLIATGSKPARPKSYGQAQFFEELDSSNYLKAKENNSLLKQFLKYPDQPDLMATLPDADVDSPQPEAPTPTESGSSQEGESTADEQAEPSDPSIVQIPSLDNPSRVLQDLPDGFQLADVSDWEFGLAGDTEETRFDTHVVVNCTVILPDASRVTSWFLYKRLLEGSVPATVRQHWRTLESSIAELPAQQDEILLKAVTIVESLDDVTPDPKAVYRVCSYDPVRDVVTAVDKAGHTRRAYQSQIRVLPDRVVLAFTVTDKEGKADKYDYTAHSNRAITKFLDAHPDFGEHSYCPTTYEDACKPGVYKIWRYIAERELAQIIDEIGAASLVPSKALYGKNALSSRFVFQINYKKGRWTPSVRWTPRGFQELPHIHYTPDNIFASCPPLASIRYLVSHASITGRKVWHLDCKRAFTTTPFKDGKKIYARMPKGYSVVDPQGVSYHFELNNSIYGLKESNSDWEDRLRLCLVKLGFKNSIQAPTIFTDKDFTLLIWVDDLFVLSTSLSESHTDSQVRKFAKALVKLLGTEVDNMGILSHALGCTFTWHPRTTTIDVSKYISTKLHDFGLERVSRQYLPIAPDYDQISAADSEPLGPEQTRKYQSLVGAALWANRCVYPEITNAVHICSKAAHSPTSGHLALAHHVWGYLAEHKDVGLRYSLDHTVGLQEDLLALPGPPAYDLTRPCAFTDASFILMQPDDNRIDKRSVNFAVVMYGGAAIDWRVQRSKGVTLSAPESELHALTSACRLLAECRRRFQDLGVNLTVKMPLPCFSDSAGAIASARQPVANSGMLHVRNEVFYCREQKQQGNTIFRWISRAINCADCCTKVIKSRVTHRRLMYFMNNNSFTSRKAKKAATVSGGSQDESDDAIERIAVVFPTPE
jgi:hypothetical protein